jgi:hypothetical protein
MDGRHEVLWIQSAANALFQTTNAETAAVWLHAGRFPDGVVNYVDFALIAIPHGDATVAVH